MNKTVESDASNMPHDAWKTAFDERHEFDIYPDHFMTGLRNEFCAGWHASIKINAVSTLVLTDEQIDEVFEPFCGAITYTGDKK